MNKKLSLLLILAMFIGMFSFACDDDEDDADAISINGPWMGELMEGDSTEPSIMYVNLPADSTECNIFVKEMALMFIGTYAYDEAAKTLTLNNGTIGNLEKTVTQVALMDDIPTKITLSNVTFSEDGKTVTADTLDSKGETGTITLTKIDKFPTSPGEVYTDGYTGATVNVSLANYTTTDFANKWAFMMINYTSGSDDPFAYYLTRFDANKEAAATLYIENTKFTSDTMTFQVGVMCLTDAVLPFSGNPPAGSIQLGTNTSFTKDATTNAVSLTEADQVTK